MLPYPVTLRKRKKITLANIGITVGPDFNTLLTGNSIGHEEAKSKLGFSAGIHLAFKISSNTFIKTGLGLGLKKYEHIHSGLVFGSDIDSSGIISMSRIESKVSYSEIQLPIKLDYYLKNNKLFFTTGVEIIYPLTNNSDQTIYLGNGSIEKLSNQIDPYAHSLNFSPLLGIGYKFLLNHKMNITVEALFKYYLKDYNVPESHLLNSGVRIALNLNQHSPSIQ